VTMHDMMLAVSYYSGLRRMVWPKRCCIPQKRWQRSIA